MASYRGKRASGRGSRRTTATTPHVGQAVFKVTKQRYRAPAVVAAPVVQAVAQAPAVVAAPAVQAVAQTPAGLMPRYHPGLVIPPPVAAGTPTPLSIAVTAVTPTVKNRHRGTARNRRLAVTIAQYAGQIPSAAFLNSPRAVMIDGYLHFNCSKQHGSKLAGHREHQLWCFFPPKVNGRPRTYCSACSS